MLQFSISTYTEKCGLKKSKASRYAGINDCFFHAFKVSQKVQTGKYWRFCDGSPFFLLTNTSNVNNC